MAHKGSSLSPIAKLPIKVLRLAAAKALSSSVAMLRVFICLLFVEISRQCPTHPVNAALHLLEIAALDHLQILMVLPCPLSVRISPISDQWISLLLGENSALVMLLLQHDRTGPVLRFSAKVLGIHVTPVAVSPLIR